VRLAILFAACLFAVPVASAQTPAQKKATIAYLQGLQTPIGAYRAAAKTTEPSLRATSGALQALKYFGGEPAEPRAWTRALTSAFVRRCFDPKSGGFADVPGGKPDPVLTAIGLMAVVELKMPRADYEKPAIRYLGAHAKTFEQVRMAAAGLEAVGRRSPQNKAWLAQIARTRNPDGTFGTGDGLARATGSAVAAILRLGGEVKDRTAILKALDAHQRRDGGFGKAGGSGSDLETTYRVLRTYKMLKAKPARAGDVRAFIARCRNADGGYGVVPGGPSSVGGTYFAGTILHWLDAK
jgi:hypothetical protein